MKKSTDVIQSLYDACVQDNSGAITRLLKKASFAKPNNRGFNALNLLGMSASTDVCKNVICKYITKNKHINHILAGAYCIGDQQKIDNLNTHIQSLDLNFVPKFNWFCGFAARGGQSAILKNTLQAMDESKIKYNEIACFAAWGGHGKLVDDLVSIMHDNNVPVKYKKIVEFAALGGHRKFVDHIVSIMCDNKITVNYQRLVESAICGGYHELVDHIASIMCDNNITIDYHGFANMIAHVGDQDRLDYILGIMRKNNIDPNYNDIISHAVCAGHHMFMVYVLEIIHDKNIISDYDRFAACAAAVKEREILCYYLSIMQDNNIIPSYDVISQIIKNHKKLEWHKSDFIELIKSWPNVNYYTAGEPSIFFLAVQHNYTDAVEVLIEVSRTKKIAIVDSFNDKKVIEVAVANKHLPIVNILLQVLQGEIDKVAFGDTKRNFLNMFLRGDYELADKAAKVNDQGLEHQPSQELIYGMRCLKFAKEGRPAENLEKIVYNADPVLRWLNQIQTATDQYKGQNEMNWTTMYAAFSESKVHDADVAVPTILECIKQHHIETVKYKCGL